MGDILLACMPFGPVFAPSIGLSLLKAELAREGIAADIRYFSIDFARRVGHAFYSGIASEGRPSNREMAGEWIFSRALFEAGCERDDEYIDTVLRERLPQHVASSDCPVSPALIAKIVGARHRADQFLSSCLDEILRRRPRLVGFTSVFQQHVASLALARRIKHAAPDTFIVMGGANCEGVMGAETVRQFSFVDAAVSGEADLVFPELVRRVLDRRPVDGLPGVRTREGVAAEFAAGTFSGGPMVRNLDDLPYPDYSDYFGQFEASPFHRDWQPSIFFESSRGCWWGERMHCTFCGLNGTTMAYRSKSASRALTELAHLTEQHPGCDVQVTDNILDVAYLKDFVPQLAARKLGVDLLYETKANLKKEQVRLLRSAGITRLQPGIESLSDAVLKLMRKGVSALQNIQLLKWTREHGIDAYWNILWGFPGEPPEEYKRLASIIPLLTHLQPPCAFGSIRLDRFSPNFFDAERLGFAGVAPLPPYRHIYSLPEEALENLAYYFIYRYKEPRDVEAYTRPLLEELRAWKRRAPRSALFSVDTDDCLLIWDLRPIARESLTVLRGLGRRLYLAADAASDARHMVEVLASPGATGAATDEIDRTLDELAARELILRDGSRFLALAIPTGTYAPPDWATERVYQIARSLGRPASEGIVVPLGPHGLAHRVPRSSRKAMRRRRQRVTPLGPAAFSLNEKGELLLRLGDP